MKVYVLDANAVIRYLSKGTGGDKVASLIYRASNGEVRLVISVMNWGEVLYTLARLTDLSTASADLKALGAFVDSVSVDEEQAEAAASLKYRYKIGYADAYAAALTLRMGATLVTADLDFAKLGKQLRVLALPRHSA